MKVYPHIQPTTENLVMVCLAVNHDYPLQQSEARELAMAILSLVDKDKKRIEAANQRCITGRRMECVETAERDGFLSGALWEAARASSDKQNPVKPKETPKEGPSDWIGDAALEIGWLGTNQQVKTFDAAVIIRKHARGHLETLNRDEELKKLNEENQNLDQETKRQAQIVKMYMDDCHAAERKLSHLKSVLKNLSSEPYNYQHPA